MRHSLAGFALLAAACTPRGSSQPPAQEPAEQPGTTAVVNVPSADAAAPATRASLGDAGLPPVAEHEQPDASPDLGMEGGVGVSMGGTLHFGTGDAGVLFDGSVTFKGGSSLVLSPELVVHSALLVPAPVPSPTFGNYMLLLFEGQADCSHRQGRHISMSSRWKSGIKSNFSKLSIANGRSEHYRAHIEVLRAPTAVGSTGAIKLDPVPGDNVRGGRVSVHVCQ